MATALRARAILDIRGPGAVRDAGVGEGLSSVFNSTADRHHFPSTERLADHLSALAFEGLRDALSIDARFTWAAGDRALRLERGADAILTRLVS